MSIFNRRNATLGWLTWMVSKRVVKKKARGAIPGKSSGKGKPALFAGLAAGLGGAAMFLRKRRRGDDLSE